ncbi:protein early flowering 3 [Phtheirospermum japonicum]|uniref:Protein early flowering 3 n=1 Tax=Phtheirospermum japonicum TaxID=374723 RepID=A0A830BHM7_9LAMI|nr:protein early flowering 3 [Phtheirospermum japonicum]
MAEHYYSYCSVGLISESPLRKSKPLTLEPANDQKPSNLNTKPLKYENIEFHNIGDENSKISENRIISETLLKTEVMPERITRKRCASVMDFSYKPTKIECINESRHLMPDDVVRVIGQRLFQRARKTILDQQKIFSSQILELHRLIKVQRNIAISPENLHEKTPEPNTPPIQFPSVDNKLLYVTPLNRSPPVAKPKTDPSTDTKLSPWFFHPPIGNQWLVPIKSPSEGLVYKPYPGPCFPTNGIAFSVPTPSLINNNGSGSSLEGEPLEKDALALFPTAPSNEVSKDEENDGDDKKSRVIRVVPHNHKFAPASAERIFRSLQEERRVRRVSSCPSHMS